ncbi:LAGLIDADG family homing endonuclease [Thermococcus sp.]|uniref:LAGLIDADG family homing endonuclease n=1 Tax=Thermococcus sp. TaxID=35749 RepID=UPI003457B4CC
MAKVYPREFLRGFFDSEGSTIVSGSYVRVKVYNYNLDILKLCQELLTGLNIHSKIYQTKRKGQLVMIRGKQYQYNSDLFTLTIYRRGVSTHIPVRLDSVSQENRTKYSCISDY